MGIFAVSIGTVILPDLSGLANEEKWEDFNSMLVQAIKIMILISIPVTFFSFVNGKEMITLLYKSKSFDDNSVMLTLGEFRFHIAGLLFIALNRIISPAFYAQRNTKLPTMAGIISFIANIILALVLVIFMKGNGIALALSLASLVNTIFLFIFMKKMNTFETKKIIKNSLIYMVKIIILSVVAAVPCYLLNPIWISAFGNYGKIISQGLPIFINFLIFATIGVFGLIVTKDDIAVTIIKKIKR